MFAEVFADILRRHCQPSAVRAIEAGGDHTPAWQAIQGSGFLELMALEEAGGAGLDLARALPTLILLGSHAVPLPVGQAIALRTLLPAGEPAPDGVPTLAPALVREAGGALCALRVPFGTLADVVLGELNGEVWLMDASGADRRPIGVRCDMTADLRWATPGNAARTLRCAVPEGGIGAWGAALHAALLAGALSRSFELTLQYANDRSQFGRTIGTFQAVQHQVALMAEHVAAARMAAASAFAADRTVPVLLNAAIAKARASEAVVEVAAIALKHPRFDELHTS